MSYEALPDGRSGIAAARHDAGWVASSLEWDRLDKEMDKLHHEVARGCGISDKAYWILSAIEESGGTAPLQELYTRWSYARQTVSSSVSSLVDRGLVELSYVEGSRKRKVASLTPAGRAFSERHIVPAMQAEERAFQTLSPQEQDELLRLLHRYSDAIRVELSCFTDAHNENAEEECVEDDELTLDNSHDVTKEGGC